MSPVVRRWIIGAAGIAGVILLWWLVAVLVFPPAPGAVNSAVPTPGQVLAQIVADGPALYWKYFSVTLTETGVGYLWGNGIALLLSAVVLLLPRFETVLMQLAVISYCIPIVALGSIAVIILGGAKTAGDPSATAVFLAAVSVFFTTVVGALHGLKAADPASLDVIDVLGGSRLTQLVKVRLIAALPSILNALSIAVPAAFLGAVLGEYMGKIDVSVGTLMITSQVQMDSPRVWALFLLSALAALVGYALVGLLARLVTPWSTGRTQA